MTPEQVKQAIDALLEKTGYQLQTVILDAHGLDISQALREQRGYLAVTGIVKRETPAPPVESTPHG